MRAGAIDQQFRPAVQIGQNRLGQIAHRGDVLGHRVVLGLVAGRAQDQAQRLGRPRPCQRSASASSAARGSSSGCGGVMFRPGAPGVTMAKRDLNSSRVVTGMALPGSAGPETCTSSALPGRDARRSGAESPTALGQLHEHAALPLHRAVGHGAVDRAGQRTHRPRGRSPALPAGHPPSAPPPGGPSISSSSTTRPFMAASRPDSRPRSAGRRFRPRAGP